MAYKMAVWRRDQVWFEFADDASQHPVATLTIETPVGLLMVMAEAEKRGRSLSLKGLHVQSQGAGRNSVGPANLNFIVRVFMEVMDIDELVVTGGVRTTGANPGRPPRERRFTRGDTD
jgi:hypothetical protein